MRAAYLRLSALSLVRTELDHRFAVAGRSESKRFERLHRPVSPQCVEHEVPNGFDGGTWGQGNARGIEEHFAVKSGEMLAGGEHGDRL